MLHWERSSGCPASMVALLGRFSLRYWVVILSVVMLTGPKDIDAVTYIVSPEGNGDHYNLYEGFSVDGFHGSGDTADSLINKCIWVDGKRGDNPLVPIEGFIMRDMSIKSCGSECVRQKNFVTGAIISNNTIEDCGIYDYVLDDGEKNGEGVYIGTADDQWTYGGDVCDLNYVSGNIIKTNGNECVDIKEGSTKNVIERNTCSKQLDEKSGCFNAKGDANTKRFNVATDCLGAGIRLGGDEVDGYKYGNYNNVYGNEIANAEYGSVKVQSDSQGLICGNICEEGACQIEGEYADTIEATCFQECHSATLSAHLDAEPTLHIASTPSPFGESLTGEPSPSPTISIDGDDIVDDDKQSITPTPSPLGVLSAEQASTPSPTVSKNLDDDDGNGDDGGDDDDDDDDDDDGDDYGVDDGDDDDDDDNDDGDDDDDDDNDDGNDYN